MNKMSCIASLIDDGLQKPHLTIRAGAKTPIAPIWPLTDRDRLRVNLTAASDHNLHSG